ncbi:MAG TPA: nucleoside recognition domain-containing protein [Syntrophales bacterium]|jgi:Fe2+ transport system protein B|nr:nucleoside recognition domain-containing protein [Syntrophales bacterium]HOX93514.1 nucleoside recognition domain-containing protein [Syntrophales bacterium]HPI56017.1 nucleoside recognition domain-containing protein [Syntrophales bacterium]HPN24093.1 nucleoside recognition domain-containing protein [Syntrophales bacterium]HQM28372.1 nucleoside recognition domain-containing protein [Syntrophales bacterium]
MSEARNRFLEGLRGGLRKGFDGFIWMMKIVLPVSFLTAILDWSGLLSKLDFLLQPLMNLIGLPAAAALPLIIGMLTNIYGGIAAMAVLPFTMEQMTLIAVFLLICHNLIQEGVVQANSGIHPVKATLFRLTAAVITVWVCSLFLDTKTPLETAPGGLQATAVPFVGMMKNWFMSMLGLSLKIFLIIMSILTFLEIMKKMGWIHPVVRAMSPLLRMMGLSRQVGMLWMTAVVFGLAYGGAVIVEEAKAGHLTRDELQELHLSIGINHSMIEDPGLFLSFGLNPFWLWVPRFIMAIIATRLLTLWVSFRERKNA